MKPIAIKSLRQIVSMGLISSLGLSSISLGFDTGTGSWGDFAPKAFLEASRPWTVYRMTGKYTKSGYPCDARNACDETKNYSVFQLRPMHRQTGIDVGVPTIIGKVSRDHTGSYSRVEILNPSNAVIARLDGARAASRVGADAAASITASRLQDSLYSKPIDLGHAESRDAALARLNPHSFYYQDDSKSVFGLTVVDKGTSFGVLQSAFSNDPFVPRFREGTFWCLSDNWEPTKGLANVLQNDQFDMSKCNGTPLLSSQTTNRLDGGAGNLLGGVLFNRQDSNVHVYDINADYRIETKVNWVCAFNCDGSAYSVYFPGDKVPMVKISSDRHFWTSSHNFKIKGVFVNRTKDPSFGEKKFEFQTMDFLRPELAKNLVALIVSEAIPTGSPAGGAAEWVQNTFLIFPPKDASSSLTDEQDLIYKVRLLNGILVMMPDQVQTSPELADAKEKLDELRLFMRVHGVGLKSGGLENVDADLLFDILSPVDATTAVTWQSPLRSQPKQGKIEWTLEELMKLR